MQINTTIRCHLKCEKSLWQIGQRNQVLGGNRKGLLLEWLQLAQTWWKAIWRESCKELWVDLPSSPTLPPLDIYPSKCHRNTDIYPNATEILIQKITYPSLVTAALVLWLLEPPGAWCGNTEGMAPTQGGTNKLECKPAFYDHGDGMGGWKTSWKEKGKCQVMSQAVKSPVIC